jgi:precorrin-2 dehydrogenase/sirohydrochlorin ferrochelatase
MVANAARSANVLVNVEDVLPLCDFHTPAVLRRGQLTLAAGTGGASPAVARAARERLEAAFPESWALALKEIAQSRAVLRQKGAGFDALVADARARLAEHGLT